MNLAELTDRFLGIYFDAHPTAAVRLGLHEYDGRLPQRSVAAIDALARSMHEIATQLNSVPVPAASTPEWLDYQLLKYASRSICHRFEGMRHWQTNLMSYVGASDVSIYVRRRYAEVDVRARAASSHLRALPSYLEQAQQNLAEGAAAVPLEVGIGVLKSQRRFVAETLAQAFAEASTGVQQELQRSIDSSLPAFDACVAALSESGSKTCGDFAIGDSNFQLMLKFSEAIDTDVDAVLAAGEADLHANAQAFRATGARLCPHGTPAEALRLAETEVQACEVVASARQLMLELKTFTIENDLVTVPEATDCNVEATPSYFRPAFAMLEAPGPYESGASEAFYYVTLPDETWPEDRQRQWLTQFEPASLALVSIHEGWPGHFLHWLHYLQSPTPLACVCDAYSSWEAWAHYCEEMVLEVGYGADDERLRLAQLQEALIRNVRLIAAIKMHRGEMSVDQAYDLFRSAAYLTDTAAREEARRGTYDPGYLNYTLGKMLLKSLRQEYRQRRPSNESLRSFHDAFLSFGAVPVPLARAMMLGEDAVLAKY